MIWIIYDNYCYYCYLFYCVSQNALQLSTCFFFLFLLPYLVSWRTRKSFCLFFLLLPKTGANNTYIISLDTLKNVFSKHFVIRDASGHWNFTCFSVFTTTSIKNKKHRETCKLDQRWEKIQEWKERENPVDK